MMMLRSSRSARQFSTFNWSALIAKQHDAETKSNLAKLQAAYAEIEQKFIAVSTPVAPIDFESYKKKMDPAFVSKIESAYKNFDWKKVDADPVEAEKLKKKKEEVKAIIAKNLEAAKKTSEASVLKVKELEERLAVLKANRTTKDTTVDDFAKLHPQLDAQVKKEIDNREWLKGTQ